ncbi:hypothetical protein [Trinickia sp.]|uniref:hypothetical protein n=1 Tax=Trinickia sp. TaxID=2571163 RepID=UPI003F7EF6A0
MTEPIVKKAAKKALHVPKGANGKAPVEAAQAIAAAPAAAAADVPPAPAKAPKQKRAATTADATPASAPKEGKTKRVKKEKVVRDSFTMPRSDYDKIAALKQKCIDAGVSTKKSELLRAGLLLLEAAPLKRLLAAVAAVETVKTGRPAKS